MGEGIERPAFLGAPCGEDISEGCWVNIEIIGRQEDVSTHFVVPVLFWSASACSSA